MSKAPRSGHLVGCIRHSVWDGLATKRSSFAVVVHAASRTVNLGQGLSQQVSQECNFVASAPGGCRREGPGAAAGGAADLDQDDIRPSVDGPTEILTTSPRGQLPRPGRQGMAKSCPPVHEGPSGRPRSTAANSVSARSIWRQCRRDSLERTQREARAITATAKVITSKGTTVAITAIAAVE